MRHISLSLCLAVSVCLSPSVFPHENFGFLGQIFMYKDIFYIIEILC